MTGAVLDAQQIQQAKLRVEQTEDGILLQMGDTIAGLDTETARQLCGWLVNHVGYYSAAKEETPANDNEPAGDLDDPDTEGEQDLGGTLPH
jgi:hypothetical protein